MSARVSNSQASSRLQTHWTQALVVPGGEGYAVGEDIVLDGQFWRLSKGRKEGRERA